MQLAGNANLALAVDSDERWIVYRVEADWNRNGLWNHALTDLTSVVKRIQVDRDVNSSLPAETTMIEGFHAAQATIKLGGTRPGDTLSIVQQLAPWRTDSSTYSSGRLAVPIRVWIGHRTWTGVEVTPQQFQGTITDVKTISGSREVELVCLDPSSGVQAAVDLPSFALPPNSVRSFGMNLMLRSNSQWVVDYVFRQNGYYMSPSPHSKCFFSATMHGSPIPERGFQAWFWIGDGSAGEEEQVYWPGRPGWGLAYGGSQRWWGVVQSRGNYTPFIPVAGRTLVMQVQADVSKAARVFPGQGGNLVMYCSGNGYLAGTSFLLKIDAAGHLFLDVYNASVLVTSVSGPLISTAGWQDIWAEIELGTPLTASTIRFPGLNVAVDLGALPTAPATTLYPHVMIFAQMPIQALQLSDRTGLAIGATRYDPVTWVPQTDLDTGLNDVTGLPLRRGVNSWSLLKEVVEAEYGVVGFSEAGRPFFKNRDTVRQSSLTTVKTLTADKILTSFGMSERSGSVRNKIRSSYARRLMDGPLDSLASWKVIWELADPGDILIQPGTNIFDITMDSPGARADAYVDPTQFTTVQWNDSANSFTTKHGFVTCNTSGVEVTTGVSVTLITPLSPETGKLDQLRIVVNNTNSAYLQFKTTDGSPAFRLRGNTYYNSTPVNQSIQRASSITKYGEKVFDLPQSDWHQLGAPLIKISNSLLRDLQQPMPVVDQITAVGDCRLQLLDAVLVQDAGGLGGPMICSIGGLSRVLEVGSGSAKLTDSLTVRPLAAPGQWILGHPTWSILNQTTKL